MSEESDSDSGDFSSGSDEDWENCNEESETEETTDLDTTVSLNSPLPQKKKQNKAPKNVSLRRKVFASLMTPKLPPKKSSSRKSVSKKSTKSSRDIESDSDSDSSLDNYLVHPDKIDIATSFFERKENLPASTSKQSEEFNTGCLTQISTPKPESNIANFGHLIDHLQKVEDLKKKASDEVELKSRRPARYSLEDDIRETLAKMEAIPVPKSVKKKRKHGRDSEVESDWEEVEDVSQIPFMDMMNSTINDVQINLELPSKKKNPKDKKDVDMEAVIKRRLNRDIKDNQMSLHKVHLTSLFANGFLTNRVLSDGYLMGLGLKLLPNQNCYPSGPTSQKYFEAITKWYKSAVSLKSQAMVLTKKKLKKKPPLKQSLAIQMTYKHAICKRDFVYIFIIILRAMGIECRLVMNLQPHPMKPPLTKLHKITMKRPSTEKSNEEEPKSKKSKVKNYDSDSSEKNSKKVAKSITTASKKSTNKTDSSSKTTKKDSSKEEPSTSKSLVVSKSNKSSSKDEKKPTLKKETSTSKKASSKKSEVNKSSTLDPPKRTRKSSTDTSKSSSRNKSSNLEPPKRASRRSSKSLDAAKSETSPTTKIDEDDKPKRKKTLSAKIEENKSSTLEPPEKVSRRSSKSLDGPKREASPNIKVDEVDKPKRKNTASTKSEENKASTLEPPKRTSRRSSTGSSKSLDVPKREASRSPSPNIKIKADDKPKTQVKKSKKEDGSTLKVVEKKSKEVKPKATKKAAPQVKESSSTVFASKSKVTSEQSEPSTSKLAQIATTAARKTRAKKMEQLDGAMDYISTSDSSDDEMCQLDGADDSLKLKKPNLKKLNKRKIFNPQDSEDDFEKTPLRKIKRSSKVSTVDRKIFSDEECTSSDSTTKCDFWVEVFCEEEEIWMPIDLFKGKVNDVGFIQKQLTSPVNYVYGFNSDQTIKDVTARYSKDWANVVRKGRVEPSWLDELLETYVPEPTPKDKREDALMKKAHLEKSLPTSVSDYKNHPLYALERHLLKFESIYPPNPPTLGFVRGEPVYARECVHTLHSREIWLKSARTVKLGETPYKIVKARPKWNKLTNEVIKDQPLEIFGYWQTQEYEPPVAENGIVPRNAFGNVELFKTCMLPIGTVHLQLPGLKNVCKRLKVDCAPAVIGFDFHGGWSHPVFDGFVICKEFEEKVIDEWNRAEDEYEKKEEERYQERVWGNWKKLIKAMLIREKLKLKYNFEQFLEPDKKKTSKK